MRPVKILFWNVDTQRDFMEKDGALPVPGADEIYSNLFALTKLAKTGDGYQVVHTADAHDENTEEISKTPDFMRTFPAHCMRGTRGAQYIDEVMPENPYIVDWKDQRLDPTAVKAHKGDYILLKDKFDVFAGNPHADAFVQAIAPDRVFVYGVAGNVCVDFAVLGLRERNIRTFVVVDAIKNLPGSSLDEMLGKWEARGARFVSVQGKEKTAADVQAVYDKYKVESLLKYLPGGC